MAPKPNSQKIEATSSQNYPDQENKVSGQIKNFGHNAYATRKTVTQGLLDIALLTANASQLKFVVEIGESHRYYVLLITLLSVSIFLQVVRGIMNVFLGSIYNIGDESHQTAATVLNNIVLALGALTTVVNAIISAFDMSGTAFIVSK